MIKLNKESIKYLLEYQKKELLKELRKEVDPSGYIAWIDVERIFNDN